MIIMQEMFVRINQVITEESFKLLKHYNCYMLNKLQLLYKHTKNAKQSLAWVSLKMINEIKKWFKTF
jgi:hypothetical protein